MGRKRKHKLVKSKNILRRHGLIKVTRSDEEIISELLVGKHTTKIDFLSLDQSTHLEKYDISINFIYNSF